MLGDLAVGGYGRRQVRKIAARPAPRIFNSMSAEIATQVWPRAATSADKSRKSRFPGWRSTGHRRNKRRSSRGRQCKPARHRGISCRLPMRRGEQRFTYGKLIAIKLQSVPKVQCFRFNFAAELAKIEPSGPSFGQVVR